MNVFEESTALKNRYIRLQGRAQEQTNTKERLESYLTTISANQIELLKNIDMYKRAVAVLKRLVDDQFGNSYRTIETVVNQWLKVIFPGNSGATRQIKITEGKEFGSKTRMNRSKELNIDIVNEDGNICSLRDDSGQGIEQLVSLLTLIVVTILTKSRRLIVCDEVLSGLSTETKRAASDIMTYFANNYGFQFICVEHAFIPKGARKYTLGLQNKRSAVVSIEDNSEGYFSSVISET